MSRTPDRAIDRRGSKLGRRMVSARRSPRDTVADEDESQTRWALGIMRKSMGAETRSADDLSLTDWLDRQAALAKPLLRRQSAPASGSGAAW